MYENPSNIIGEGDGVVGYKGPEFEKLLNKVGTQLDKRHHCLS
jgi:hypothetical protein